MPVAHWRQPLIWLALAWAASLLLYAEPLAGMIHVWSNSDTFAHGFLILPISLWLLWQQRYDLALMLPKPDYRALLVVFLAGLLWRVANVISLQIVEQLALVTLLQGVTLAVLGWEMYRRILFPMLFLYAAVPMGYELVPPMMDFTAVFTVWALRSTGIPVYSEGLYFVIPSGSWSVIEACSGVRYLIASVTLGFLYAYLTYQSFWRRVAFILLATIFPVIANGLRAYIIVMIAHLSDNKLAHGVDHFIYGWVFFGMVIMFLFWIGNFWREPHHPRVEAPAEDELPRPLETQNWTKVVIPAVLLAALWPAQAYWSPVKQGSAEGPRLPAELESWQTTDQRFSEWAPLYVGVDQQRHQVYQSGENRVGVYFQYYRTSRKGHEVVSNLNMLVEEQHPKWRLLWQESVDSQHDHVASVLQSRVAAYPTSLMMWQWYWVDGVFTDNPYEVKARQLLAAMMGRSQAAASVILYTPLYEKDEEAQARLRDFSAGFTPEILETP